MLIYIYALIQSSCRFTLLLPVGQWVYDKSRVLLKTPLRVLTVYPCSRRILSQKRNRLRCPTKQASLALEASFIAQRSKLHFFGVFS